MTAGIENLPAGINIASTCIEMELPSVQNMPAGLNSATTNVEAVSEVHRLYLQVNTSHPWV